MKHGYRLGLASALVLAAIAVRLPAAADDELGPFKRMDTAAGIVFADPNGMTLYTYDEDPVGQSRCVDQCAVNWPPVMATADDEPIGDDFTIITRPDGTLQWAYEGRALYTFIQDKKPGDVTGDNMKNVWHAVTDD